MHKLKYNNPVYKIAFSSWKEMYFLEKRPTLLLPEVYQGKMVYRARGSAKKVAYTALKKDSLKKEVLMHFNLPF